MERNVRLIDHGIPTSELTKLTERRHQYFDEENFELPVSDIETLKIIFMHAQLSAYVAGMEFAMARLDFQPQHQVKKLGI